MLLKLRMNIRSCSVTRFPMYVLHDVLQMIKFRTKFLTQIVVTNVIFYVPSFTLDLNQSLPCLTIVLFLVTILKMSFLEHKYSGT